MTGLAEICFGFRFYDDYRRIAGAGRTELLSEIDRKMHTCSHDMRNILCGSTNFTRKYIKILKILATNLALIIYRVAHEMSYHFIIPLKS